MKTIFLKVTCTCLMIALLTACEAPIGEITQKNITLDSGTVLQLDTTNVYLAYFSDIGGIEGITHLGLVKINDGSIALQNNRDPNLHAIEKPNRKTFLVRFKLPVAELNTVLGITTVKEIVDLLKEVFTKIESETKWSDATYLAISPYANDPSNEQSEEHAIIYEKLSDGKWRMKELYYNIIMLKYNGNPYLLFTTKEVLE